METLKNSYMVVPLAVLVIIVLTFINSKITKENINKNTYLKLSFIVGIMVALTVYVNNTSTVASEILKGPAPF